MGAAAAANCHPCMDYHLARCDELEINRDEVIAAATVGLTVNRGAESAIRKKSRELLGAPVLSTRWALRIIRSSVEFSGRRLLCGAPARLT